jgi:uncharacterized YccA/Bax inhibitor family protein
MRTANPTLNANTFTGFQVAGATSNAMTIQGTVNKTFVLTALLLASAMWTWGRFFQSGDPAGIIPYAIGGAVGGLIFALITAFKKNWAMITGSLYAVCEGFFIGGISAVFEKMYPGIVIQAVALTIGTLVGLLMAYKSGLIKVTENFKLGVAAATMGIALFYFVTWILGMFGVGMPIVYGSGLLSIGISVVIVVIAALNLVLDFDFIESGAQQGAPKYMEWYAAFGLMVTLIWLYIEILRLLAKLNQRRN